jgi:hypothetical protein
MVCLVIAALDRKFLRGIGRALVTRRYPTLSLDQYRAVCHIPKKAIVMRESCLV